MDKNFIAGLVTGILIFFICYKQSNDTPLWQWILVIIIWIPILYIRCSELNRKIKEKKK